MCNINERIKKGDKVVIISVDEENEIKIDNWKTKDVTRLIGVVDRIDYLVSTAKDATKTVVDIKLSAKSQKILRTRLRCSWPGPIVSITNPILLKVE